MIRTICVFVPWIAQTNWAYVWANFLINECVRTRNHLLVLFHSFITDQSDLNCKNTHSVLGILYTKYTKNDVDKNENSVNNSHFANVDEDNHQFEFVCYLFNDLNELNCCSFFLLSVLFQVDDCIHFRQRQCLDQSFAFRLYIIFFFSEWIFGNSSSEFICIWWKTHEIRQNVTKNENGVRDDIKWKPNRF